MKKKTKIIILSILVIIVGIVFTIILLPDKKEEDKKEQEIIIKPTLYEVTKTGSDSKVYLFGSIHVADKRAFPLPKEVMDAYNESDYIAVEFDVDEFMDDTASQISMLQMMLYSNDKTLKSELDEETYNALVRYLKAHDMYNKNYESYRPVFQYMLLSEIQSSKSKLSSDMGIDMYFLDRAKKDNKGILEYESPMYQYSMLTDLPDELFIYFIEESIKNEKSSIISERLLYEMWLMGKVDIVAKLSEVFDYEEDDKHLQEMLDEYNTALEDIRNDEMTEKTREFFHVNKSVFVVVGAMHIVGEDGIANQLRDYGYTVKEIRY